jgi:RHH-type proline utilization regulon transcriptional repressor/proline dehydrogenase/delta 1-pyrroline-5-carboxylate dehydrogenase
MARAVKQRQARPDGGVDARRCARRIERSVEVPHVAVLMPNRPLALLQRAQSAIKWASCRLQRAKVLRDSADALSSGCLNFALLVKGSLQNMVPVSEVREAVDFCAAPTRPKAHHGISLPGPTGGTNELRLSARGVWVCISPFSR